MDPLQARANFFRMCRLLVDKGGEALRVALRVTLHALHPPPPNLATVLNANKHVLQKIKVINSSQWNLLFPTSGAAPDSNNFDVSLLTILLRNICRLSPPATGWDVMPPAEDVSTSADIARIKIFRNQIYGHVASAQLDDATFNTSWQEISDPLIRLGVPQKDIDEIKAAPLSPEEESYIQQLKEWKERDEDILSELKDMKKEISELRGKFETTPPQLTTGCLPDKLPLFTGREDEIQEVITFLKDEEKAVVALHGGPGFGKTAIAIQISDKLSKEHKIPVFFSQLTTATNEDEMIRQLCLDAGVNYEDDPKKAFMLWLKNIRSGVMFVMDDIDNLLRERTSFYEFLRWLRKNSHQQCQIVTTSRASFEIPELSTQQIQIYEMDDKACVELLKKQCPHEDVNFLRQLAKLCGNIPLAMCIAASRMNDFEDSAELLQHLKKQPMKTLECPESDQYINRAINMSYEKCLDEEQKMLGRLSVFEGGFSKSAAGTVIEKGNLDTTNILKKLVSLSLIEESTDHRYSIHLLIKHFLKDKQESGKDAEDEKAEAKCAKVLMVEYFLKLGHQLTMESYSKDGYKDARKALKREASNIQNILKICCQQKDPTSSDISDCLQRSKIYNTSAKFFSLFVRTIISGSIVDEFLQQCAKKADERNHLAIKINFDCLIADQEHTKTIDSHDDHFISKMEEINKEFDTHYEDLKNDTPLCAHYYYLYRKYLLRQSKNHSGKERLDLEVEARKYMEKSLKLSEALADTPSEKADEVFSLLHLGNTWKMVAATEHWLKKNNASKMSSTKAEKYYREAIKLSQDELGDHELTSSCHKSLGDLFFTMKKDDLPLAEIEYTTAKNMREKLGLDASERHVRLLNNLGKCLSETNRAEEAIEILESARDTAEKLAESDELTVCKTCTKVYASLAIANDLIHNYYKAVSYAEKALEFNPTRIKNILKNYELEKLLEIVRRNRITRW